MEQRPEQQASTSISMTQLREAIERISDSLELATSVRAGQHAIDYFKVTYSTQIRATLPPPPHTMFGLPVVPDETIDPHEWRVVDADGNVKANGVIPVRLEDGERIGTARLNDDGTVTVYVLRPDILDKVTDHFGSYSLGPAPEAGPGFRREVQKMAEDMAASRVTKPIIITEI